MAYLTPFRIKMSGHLHREFKTTASSLGMTMNEFATTALQEKIGKERGRK